MTSRPYNQPVWIAVVGLALLVVGVLVFAQVMGNKAKKRAIAFLEALKSIQPNPKPKTITPVPAPDANWELPNVAQIAGPLRQRGFDPVGVFELHEVPGLECYQLAHSESLCFVLIHRLKESGIVWYEFNAHQDDGTVLELSSTPFLKSPPSRPGKVTKNVMDFHPESALFEFSKMCRGKSLKPIAPEQILEVIRSEWESAYAHHGASKE